jgi:hypothetical protein
MPTPACKHPKVWIVRPELETLYVLMRSTTPGVVENRMVVGTLEWCMTCGSFLVAGQWHAPRWSSEENPRNSRMK